MNYYQEITLIPQIEVPLYFIWQKLYAQLHLALVEQKNADEQVEIGVSFPEYGYEHGKFGYLGSKLRIFATSEIQLQQLDLATWLARLSDYVHLKSIQKVPLDKVTGYAIYRRKHLKDGFEKQAKRNMNRLNKKGQNITFEAALAHIQARYGVDYISTKCESNLPFIQINSASTKQGFRLFVEKVVVTELQQNRFGTYGLSAFELDKASSVPDF